MRFGWWVVLWFSFLGFACVGGALAEEASEKLKALEEVFGQGPQEEDLYRAERLLITATGSQVPVRLAPSVASVITAEEIEEMGATTLDEVLETVPGFHVEPSGTALLMSIWSIRGIHTAINPHALLLINSIPLVSPETGSRPFHFSMPVSMISRVEVVRGPGSALYGADAFSGIVNVITKDNHEIYGTRIGGRYGSFGRSDIWLQHGATYSGWDMAVGMEWQKTKGDENRVVEEDFLHHLGVASLSNAPGFLDSRNEVLDTHLNLRKEHWNFHLYSSLQDTAMGLGARQVLSSDNDGDRTRLLASLNYENSDLFRDWQLSGRLYYSYLLEDNLFQILPASLLNMRGNPIMEFHNGGVELSALYSGFFDQRIRLGAGWKNYESDPDQYKNFGEVAGDDQYGDMVHVSDPDHIYESDANRHLFYLLVQDEWSFAKGWDLTLGVRYDEYSDFGSTVNPRGALVWETSYALTTKLMYGQAFRAPSFGEQYVKNNPMTIGNPDLDPEEIETLELAFDFQPSGDFRFVATAFIYEAKELIELSGEVIPQPYINFGEQEGKGVELEMEWQIMGSLRLKANYAQQRSRYKETDSLVPDAPGSQFYFNPHWQFLENWTLDGQYIRVADRHRAADDPRDDIDDYDLVHITFRRKDIAKNFEAALAVRNLFDKTSCIPSPYASDALEGAYVPDDYPMEGRAIWFELSAHF